ncbi:MAG: adenylate/guanylate cyclase domain-containing protein [Candidatus Limnocylindria bacterium]
MSLAKILAVDDTPANLRVLEAILVPRGYAVITATSGQEALEKLRGERPDLVLADIVMPGMNGYELCRRIREDPATRFLPVVMITASGDRERVQAIEAGADDFMPKPVDQLELLARVKSLLRVKEYHDTIERQSAELAEWNRTLEARVREQVEQLERADRLRRFLSPQIADLVLSQGGEALLQGHRREITVVFCDLRGFTAFSETAEPEEALAILGDYHRVLGALIFEHEGTLEHFAGDGVMVFFNDPVPVADHAQRAVRLALGVRERMEELCRAWRRRGHELGFGAGIAMGYATLGRIGFEGRHDYGAIGPVTSLAFRLASEAKPGQILVSQRVWAAVEEHVEAEPLGELSVKGFARPVAAYNLVRARTPQARVG